MYRQFISAEVFRDKILVSPAALPHLAYESYFRMKILRALGVGVFLLVLAFILPPVLTELSKTLVVILQSVAQAFATAGMLAASITPLK